MLQFYYGSDTYRLKNALKELVAPRIIQLSANTEEGLVELERTLKYPSFFQEETIVIAHNALANGETAAEVHRILKQYKAEAIPETTVIVVQGGEGGRESAATKTLTAYATKHSKESRSFEPLTGAALYHWIADYCSACHCTIEPHAIELLVRFTNGESWAMANELEKLCSYVHPGIINNETVKLLVSSMQEERDDFALSRALSQQNKRQALVALWQRLQEGAPEQLILGLLAYSVRTLMTRNTAGYQFQKLQNAHAALARMDRASKNGQLHLEDSLFSVILDM